MMSLRGAKPERIDPAQRWSEWVDGRTSDPLIRRFIMGLSVVNSYSADPGTLSARGMVRHLKDNMFASDYVGYMSGGWSAIYDVFADALREHGGEIVTGARVDTIEMRDGLACAAIVGGERYEAGAFVCTLPPQETPSIAEAGTPLATELARWSNVQDVRACCIDLGFSRRLRTDCSFIFDIEHDLYFSLHSEVTPDLAPAGGQLLHAMAYLSPEDASSDAAAARRKTELTDGLDRFFAGWREAAVVERTLPNVRVVSARRTPEQYGENAMPLRSASASNLYFANDARDLPYHLTNTCFAAAIEVADTIGREITPGTRTVAAPQRAAVGV
jgi:phytoene dehydrogenase-like protein